MTHIKTLSRQRFGEAFALLNHISSVAPKTPLTPHPVEVKIMKGLFYVHLYSVIEKVINALVEEAVRQINSLNVRNADYIVPFNVISLNAKLRSLKDSSYRNFFKKSIEVFENVEATDVFPLDETMFSRDLQNTWFATIQEVLFSFGIRDFSASQNETTTVDEIVDKRNAISHGRMSPAEVGERNTIKELRTKYDVANAFLDRLVTHFESYIAQQQFMVVSARGP